MFNVNHSLFNASGREKLAMASRRSGEEPVLTGFADAGQPRLLDDTQSTLEPERIRMVLDTARSEGMLEEKTARISGRISPALVSRAKARTGIASDSELIEFALASLALDDDFAAVFERVKGTIDPDIPLGY